MAPTTGTVSDHDVQSPPRTDDSVVWTPASPSSVQPGARTNGPRSAFSGLSHGPFGGRGHTNSQGRAGSQSTPACREQGSPPPPAPATLPCEHTSPRAHQPSVTGKAASLGEPCSGRRGQLPALTASLSRPWRPRAGAPVLGLLLHVLVQPTRTQGAASAAVQGRRARPGHSASKAPGGQGLTMSALHNGNGGFLPSAV